ncbi:MAG: glycosyltransferase family 2 protein [Myxococcaceae bacterium]|nr:glycosyltransferase family 2 protein [Myxococcaceae bacterium]
MSALPLSPDPELKLLLPVTDEPEPEVSIVIPALNEEITIAEFVAWCHEGLSKAGIKGEVVIVDSSTDATAERALKAGARVLKAPKRGLGRAYIDALPFIRGRYVMMGDCDCTYDFRELKAFVEKFREGYEFIMGSRFKGYIEPGAMPPLHQYFGTPITTMILNVIFASKFSDIHCGMRGLTKDALLRIDLQSQGWEYASEMVLKSVHCRLRTAEVPIRFLKDREGRLSHHRRMGWLSPWLAGWDNLRAMFVYGAHFFLYRPGWVLLLLGLLVTLPQAAGPVTVGELTFSLHWMLFGVSAVIVGLQSIYLGVLMKVLFDFTGAATPVWLRRFRYDRTVALSIMTGLVGLGLGLPLVTDYAQHGYQLSTLGWKSHLAVIGLLTAVASFMTFTFTLVLHATQVAARRRR